MPPLVAVITVDVQIDFLDPTVSPLAGDGRKAFCLPGVEKLVAHARANSWPVFHVQTVHDGLDTLPNHLRRSHSKAYCLRGERGTDLAIASTAHDRMITKRLFSAFRETGLADRLREANVRQLMFCGVATDCCILHSAFDADELGFSAFVPLQAVSASTAESFSAGLVSIAKSAAHILDLGRVLDGADCETARIPLSEVASLATHWFTERTVRIDGLGKPTRLDAIRRALGE